MPSLAGACRNAWFAALAIGLVAGGLGALPHLSAWVPATCILAGIITAHLALVRGAHRRPRPHDRVRADRVSRQREHTMLTASFRERTVFALSARSRR